MLKSKNIFMKKLKAYFTQFCEADFSTSTVVCVDPTVFQNAVVLTSSSKIRLDASAIFRLKENMFSDPSILEKLHLLQTEEHIGLW